MENRNDYQHQYNGQVPIIRPKKVSESPFYALLMHKKRISASQYQKVSGYNPESNRAFPKREFKHKGRSRTISDNQSIELPKINEKKWEPKKIHMYYNLNYLIQQTRTSNNTLQD